MIQELLGGAGVLGGERKISISGVLLEGTPSSSPSPSSSSPTATTTTTTTTTSSSDQQNLRCPRCDSSNTKFCYYNNYNLTQPRHFCKTCRRYWTKGGALRNVPIGGGCRKNKNTTSASTTAGKSNTGKVKTTSSDIVRSSLGFDHEPASNPILWASPQNSQLLTLLRASQNPNPNPNPNLISNPLSIKVEGSMIGSHMFSDSAVVTGAINARPISFDPPSQAPIGLCSSLWRNNQHHQPPQHHHHHHHHLQQQQQQHNLLMGDVQNTGIQELYQRLRSSTNYYTDNHSPTLLGNVASTSSSSSTIMEPSTIAGGEMGYWNPAFSWSNLPTTNGTFP